VNAVAKTCPSCGYSLIGPFTDNCPICAEPVRNVRSDPARSSWPAGVPWVRWVLGGTAALVLVVGGCCGLGLWRLGTAIQDAQKAAVRARDDAEAQRKARTVAVSAAALLKEFQDDPAAADRKHKGKLLEVAGVVERWGKTGGLPFVILHAGDEKAPLKIECFLGHGGDEDEDGVQPPGKGQPITVRGEYAGRVSHIQLRGGVLVK
jgi:hypothetical protein